MIKITAEFLINRRKMQWESHRDIKKDEYFVKGVAYEITQNNELREETIDDPSKLIELCFTVVNKDKREEPFFLNDVQKEFINILNQAIKDFEDGLITSISLLVLKGRQQGFTTLITAYQLAAIITRRNFEGLTLADESSNAEAIFQNKAKFIYDRLPEILKPTEKYNSKRQLLFEKLNSSWAINTATKEVGRSRTINFFHGSECGFWRDGISSIQASLGETFTKNAIKIYESTANGFNDFREMWKSGAHINCFFQWWKTKEYRLNFETKNMRTKFLNDIDRNKGEWIYDRLKWLRDEKKLDENQLYWYFKKYQGYIDKELIKQEYPCTPDEAFVASGKCYFNKDNIIKRIDLLEEQENTIEDIGYFKHDIVIKNDRKVITDIKWISDPLGCIKLIKKPEEYKPYVLGGDTAGEGSDNFTGIVTDNTNGKIAAVLKHEQDETFYTRQIYCLGWYYNKALIGLETNFSTYPTKMLAEEYEYPNLYVRDKEDDYTGKIVKAYGFRTDRITRPLILAELQRIFEEEIEKITDIDILKEALTFIKNEKGRAEAQEGCHDDLIMGTAITYYIASQQTTSRIYPTGEKPRDSIYQFQEDEYIEDEGQEIEII
jgi:hypothetical protein|nr:MAG TPA: Terminase large subunit [Caudoviricetes sp.]